MCTEFMASDCGYRYKNPSRVPFSSDASRMLSLAFFSRFWSRSHRLV